MVIHKNSWHYKVWKFSYTLMDRRAPEQTNLCQYFCRIFLYVPFIFFAVFSVMIVGGSILVVFPNIITILLGLGILIPVMDNTGKNPYRLHSFKFGQIPLWTIVCPLWLLIILMILTGFYPLYIAYVLIGVAMIFLLLSAMARLVIATDWSIVKEYIKAKKHKVCPIITFE